MRAYIRTALYGGSHAAGGPAPEGGDAASGPANDDDVIDAEFEEA